MSIFDLQKRQEAVQFVLEKRQVTKAPVMRVGAAFDVSGSAKHMYMDGTIQKTVDRLVPVAMRFDDNGEMDVWAFHNEFSQMPTVTKQNMDGYVKQDILGGKFPLWGGTSYAPVMEDMSSFYFGGGAKAPKKSGGFLGSLFGKPAAPAAPAPSSNGALPAMALFITDGANRDISAAAAVLRNARDLPVYWQLIGVGDPREFTFLQEQADLLPNVGFVHLTNLNLSDEALYDKLLSQELCDWLKGR